MDDRSSAERLMFLETHVNVLTVELSLFHEWILKTTGAPVLNTDSDYYKSVHVPSLEMKAIRKSLEKFDELDHESSAADSEAQSASAPAGINSEPGSSEKEDNEAMKMTMAENNLPPEAAGMAVKEETNDLELSDNGPTPLGNRDPSMPVLVKEVEFIYDSDEEDLGNDNSNAANTRTVEEVKGHAIGLLRSTKPKPYVRITKAENKAARAHMKSRILSPSKSGSIRRQQSRGRDGEHKSYQCGYCPATFPYDHRRKIHQRKHTGEKPYKCQYCPASFSTNQAKIIHERIHTGEKPYQCQYCPVSFASQARKVCHERRHTGEKPYQCQYCPASFSANQVKIVHERNHTGEKPYSCLYCNKTFNQSGNLTVHHRIHTKEKPFLCTICQKSFAHISTLRIHQYHHQA